MLVALQSIGFLTKSISSMRDNFPDEISYQRWLRIKLSLAAYAYEFENQNIMDDATFDLLSLYVDVTIFTGNELLDVFFLTEFQPCTGMWIRKHPELDKLAKLYQKIAPTGKNL